MFVLERELLKRDILNLNIHSNLLGPYTGLHRICMATFETHLRGCYYIGAIASSRVALTHLMPRLPTVPLNVC